MNKKEIIEIYKVISAMYEKYLKKYGVKPINLYDKNNNYTKDALTLIYLSKYYPNTKAISKQELTDFIRQFYPETNDVQQARHLNKKVIILFLEQEEI